MNRYDTEEWKELESIQNELAGYVPVDILTITGFMNTRGLEAHLEACKQRLEKYKQQ